MIWTREVRRVLQPRAAFRFLLSMGSFSFAAQGVERARAGAFHSTAFAGRFGSVGSVGGTTHGTRSPSQNGSKLAEKWPLHAARSRPVSARFGLGTNRTTSVPEEPRRKT